MNKYILLVILFFAVEYSGAQTWKSYGSGLNYPVNTVCYFNNTLYAGAGSVYSWNGSTWNNNSDGMIFMMDVYTMTVFNGSLFSGGYFSVLTPEGNWYNNTGRLNNGSWTTCGSGMNSDGSGMSDYVNTLIVYNGELYAGGRFGTAGGDPLSQTEAPYIARFDGSVWKSVGSGMDYTVTDLVVYNNELIASGFFNVAGGTTANYIAKWNGSVWSPLGTGMDGKVTALAVYNNELYAGGLFYKAGGVDASSIAKWNGQSWSPVGSGVAGGGQVYHMAVYNNELYAGGTFRQFAGNAGEYLMKWNGSQWLPVGTGTDGPVVYIYPNGSDLIIGGDFTTVDGISAKNIAVYSTTTGITDDRNIPDRFSLFQNYPNPFNPVTKIKYSIPAQSKVEIKIYNILGNEISTLLSEEKLAGVYETEWKAENFPSGIYFCTLTAGNFKSTRKMMLVK